MKKSLIALALVFAMAGTLAACSSRDSSGGTNGANGVTGSGSGTNNGTTTGQTAGSGTGTAGRTSYYGTNRNRAVNGADSYLADGQYRANSDGQVYGRGGSETWDLTQDARDMVRGAGRAVGDVGDGIGDAVRDITGMDDTYDAYGEF